MTLMVICWQISPGDCGEFVLQNWQAPIGAWRQAASPAILQPALLLTSRAEQAELECLYNVSL